MSLVEVSGVEAKMVAPSRTDRAAQNHENLAKSPRVVVVVAFPPQIQQTNICIL